MILQDISRSGNILYLDYFNDETKKIETTTEVLCTRHQIQTYNDMYEYMSDKDISNGTFAMAVLLDGEYAEWYKPELYWGYHKNAIMLFAGMDKKLVDKLLKPFKAKKKVVDKNLKVIDFEIYGRQLKLYLGKPDCEDYWGDDWNDTPYEHNAGTVYSQYVEDTVVVNFLGDDEYILEACEGYCNSPWCKEDFKKGAPFAYIDRSTEDDSDGYSWGRRSFVDNPKAEKFYYNTPIKEFYKKKYLITEA